MPKIFNDYLVGAEREAAIEEAYYDNMFSRLNTMYEMVSMQHEQMLKDAEYKVFSESGTYDDLSYYISEAQQETGEQKKNILQQMADVITSIIRKIIDGVKGIFGKTNPEQEVEVDSGLMNAANAVKSKVNDINQSLNNNNIPAALIAIASLGVGAFAIKKTGVMQKVKAKAVESDCKFLQDIMARIESFTEKVKSFFGRNNNNADESDANQNMGLLKKMVTSIGSILTEFKNALFHKNGDGQNQEGEPQDNNQNPQVNPNNLDPNDPHAAEKFAGQNNAVTVKKIGNDTWKVDKNNGNVTKVGADGKEVSVADDEIPANIKAISQRAKGKVAMDARNAANTEANNEKIKKNLKGKNILGNIADGSISVDKTTGKIYQMVNGAPVYIRPQDLGNVINSNPNMSERDKTKLYNKIKQQADAIHTKKRRNAPIERVANGMNNGNVHESVDEDIMNLCELLQEAGFDVILEDLSDVVDGDEFVESTSESIFGYDYEEEALIEESEKFEKDLKDLSDMFLDL